MQHEQLVKVFMAPHNSARATPHQQPPSMSSLVFTSICSSLFSTRLRLQAWPLLLAGCLQTQWLQDAATLLPPSWSKYITPGAKSVPQGQIHQRYAVLPCLVQVILTFTHNDTLGGHVSMHEYSC